MESVRSGYTLIEAVMALLLTSVVLVSGLSLVPAIASGGAVVAERVRLEHLAIDLLVEMEGVDFDGNASSVFKAKRAFTVGTVKPIASGDAVLKLVSGPIAAPDAGRSLFNDLGDYDGWSSSPPVRRDGSEITGFVGVTRSVEVSSVDPATLVDSSDDTGVRRVSVTVSRAGGISERVTVFRTRSGERLR